MALKRKRFRPTTNMADAEMDREPSPEPVGTPVLRDLGDFNVAVAAVATAETMDAMQTDAAFDDSTGDASAALGGLGSDRTSYADADMPLDSLRQGSDAVDGQQAAASGTAAAGSGGSGPGPASAAARRLLDDTSDARAAAPADLPAGCWSLLLWAIDRDTTRCAQRCRPPYNAHNTNAQHTAAGARAGLRVEMV